MASKRRDGLPTFWTTHLAKVIVGDQPCRLAPWLSGHMLLQKRARDQIQLAEWKRQHTSLLTETAGRLSDGQWACSLEQFFRVKGASAIVTGKVDLIARKTDERPIIVDTKAGEPRESDVVQVCLEMLLVPMAWGSPSMTFGGLVIYADHPTVTIAAATAAGYREPLFRLVKELALGTKPTAQPSESTCRFCDVSEDDCPHRWTESEIPASTTEF